MPIIEFLFVFGLIIILYSYMGYGILLWLLVKVKKLFKTPSLPNTGFEPEVTMIVAAYNEQDFIEEKIANTLSLDYNPEKLKLIFVSDGSTDNTPAIISKYPQIEFLHETKRNGKVAAMHRAMSYVSTPYVIFSDANTLLNRESISNIVRNYINPQVGGVAGEKKIIIKQNETISAAGEGMYWKYESVLKKLDWHFHTVVGAAGELFSVRKELYTFSGNNILLDDFVISLLVCKKGYRVAYEPEAYAMETASASLKEEQKRKVRISAGAFQAMHLLKDLLNIFKYPKLSFQYISHRVLRWTLCPLFLPIIFICNILLVIYQPSFFYSVTMVAQVLFYLMAFLGWLFSRVGTKVGVLYAPYYFVFINVSLYMGFARYIGGKQSVLWEKARRKEYSG